ncbi:MAG: hypothetical protein H6551_07635 [Chitinophagales bacterium]|nr:hypothetical protein [Chitinophagaceae bacterium]MCB9065001.1 hypothetical protein [Chitinophagales bacterium]
MKNLLTPLIILLFSTAMFSCKKEKSSDFQEYTCVCVGGITGKYYEEKPIYSTSKQDAEEVCSKYGSSPNVADGIYCDLK